MKNKFYLLSILLILLVSCKTRDKKSSELNYMQNIEKVAIENVTKDTRTTLQIGDELVILVSGRDQDILKPFNQNYASSDPIRSASTANINRFQERVSGPTYIVDNDGTIDFPIFGNINAEGRTIEQLRGDIKNRLKRYVKTPTSVNIRLTNFEISVFGEVKRANKYRVDGASKPTVLDAIALAGDLSIYGRRDNVLVIRNENGNVIKGTLNLKDANFINSPFYYLKQGDAIIVSANKNREIQAKTNPNLGLYISIVSVGIGALSLILSLTK